MQFEKLRSIVNLTSSVSQDACATNPVLHHQRQEERSSADTSCRVKNGRLGGLTATSRLNEMGISYALQGQFDKAMESFDSALSRVLSRGGPFQTPSYCQLNGISYSASDGSTLAESNSSFTNERLDYDEGFDIFSGFVDVWGHEAVGTSADPRQCQCLPLSQTTPSLQDVAITLLYNLGQALIRSRIQIDVAERVFMDAFNLIQQSTPPQDRFHHVPDDEMSACGVLSSAGPSNSHRLLVPILHRIGYVKYWKKDIPGAIDVFQLALTHCSKSWSTPLEGNDSASSFGSFSLDGSEDIMAAQGDQSFPEDDLVLAATLNCLGVLYFHLPKPETEKSLEFLVKALDQQRHHCNPLGNAKLGFSMSLPTVDSFGSTRTATVVATTLNNIGRIHFTCGRLDMAIESYSESLSIRRAILGPDHPDVAATVYNAGQTFHQLGQLTKALETYREFVRIALKTGKSNRYLVIVLKCMALIYQEQKDNKQALTFFHQALTVGRSILGTHGVVASILNKLGNLYYEMGDSDAAFEMYREGLAVERIVLDSNHPNIAVTLSNIGQICKQRGDFAGALRLYEEALVIQTAPTTTSDILDPSVAVTLSNIGLIHYQTKKYAAALELYQEALRIRRELFGENSLDVASCLNSIGLVLFKLGLAEMAYQSFAESLRIRRHVQGQSHRDIAIIMYNIATIHLELGNDDEAIRCYRETLQVERAALGPDHEDVLSTLQYLARVYQRRGEIVTALEYFGDVLSIQRRCNSDGKNNAVIAKTLNMIANLRLQRGEVTNALEAMAEASRIARQSDSIDEDDIELAGFDLYAIAKLHPEAAGAA